VSKLDHEGVSDFQLLGMEYRRDDVESEVLYSEAQLNTTLFDDAIDFVTGGNYFFERSEAPNYVISRRGTSVFPTPQQQALSTFNINNYAFGNADAGLFRTADTFTRQESESFGVFANGTWHITPALDLTGGLRYSHDNKDYTQRRFAEFLPSGALGAFRTPPGTNSTTVQDDATFEQIDYRATIDYDFTPDIMAYATVSKAYKAGTYSYTIQSWTAANNATGANQSAVIEAIPPEEVQNFEVGSRMTLFDGHLRFNPTLFYMQYTNRQAARQVAQELLAGGGHPRELARRRRALGAGREEEERERRAPHSRIRRRASRAAAMRASIQGTSPAAIAWRQPASSAA